MTSKFYVLQSITYKDFKDTLAKESLNLFRYSLNTRLYKVNGKVKDFSYFMPFNILLDSSRYALNKGLRSLKTNTNLFNYTFIDSILESSENLEFIKGRLKRVKLKDIRLPLYVAFEKSYYKCLAFPAITNNEIFFSIFVYHKTHKT